jgi:hypothetical protein
MARGLSGAGRVTVELDARASQWNVESLTTTVKRIAAYAEPLGNA